MNQEDRQKVIDLIKTWKIKELDYDDVFVRCTMADGYWFMFPFDDVVAIDKKTIGKLMFEFKTGK